MTTTPARCGGPSSRSMPRGCSRWRPSGTTTTRVTSSTEEAGDVGAEGYVFFHAQDVERVVDGPGTLHLRYAAARYTATSAADKYAEDEAVGRRVVAALEGEGLAPTWDGSGASTITLERLRWYPVPGDA